MLWFDNLEKVLEIQSKDRVRRQSDNLAWLAENGWRDTSLAAELAGLMEKTLPDGRVIIATRELALSIEDALQAVDSNV
mgnify:CR=1 FL=1